MALEFAQPLGVDDVGEIEVWLVSLYHIDIHIRTSLHCLYYSTHAKI
jgi:hypothetical protein